MELVQQEGGVRPKVLTKSRQDERAREQILFVQGTYAKYLSQEDKGC